MCDEKEREGQSKVIISSRMRKKHTIFTVFSSFLQNIFLQLKRRIVKNEGEKAASTSEEEKMTMSF